MDKAKYVLLIVITLAVVILVIGVFYIIARTTLSDIPLFATNQLPQERYIDFSNTNLEIQKNSGNSLQKIDYDFKI